MCAAKGGLRDKVSSSTSTCNPADPEELLRAGVGGWGEVSEPSLHYLHVLRIGSGNRPEANDIVQGSSFHLASRGLCVPFPGPERDIGRGKDRKI